MECDFNLLCYGLFKIPKIIIILKALLSIKKILFKKYYFVIFLCLIIAWFEIGNGKKCYFQYHLNIHILSQFSTTLKKDFVKGL
jgi:hypothetical protein